MHNDVLNRLNGHSKKLQETMQEPTTAGRIIKDKDRAVSLDPENIKMKELNKLLEKLYQ